MLDNLILVSVLGGVVGIGVGFYYKKVFVLTLDKISEIFYKIFFVHNFFKLISDPRQYRGQQIPLNS
ncbi:hypothetical protein F985_03849 [Acinetobacter seifertii]|uniref:Uncharacterized protein n=1 Tax=Acinetobacter seifertii TaxID=1530123 RepID=N8QW44_9GAMM|nr:hypothetical protein F985_03849 [Acinetobacter seifertii]